jgi:hypothetical protein
MVFLTKVNGYQKLYNSNKNVTKMGMIIEGVYCTSKTMNKIYISNMHCSKVLILGKQVKISDIPY